MQLLDNPLDEHLVRLPFDDEKGASLMRPASRGEAPDQERKLPKVRLLIRGPNTRKQ